MPLAAIKQIGQAMRLRKTNEDALQQCRDRVRADLFVHVLGRGIRHFKNYSRELADAILPIACRAVCAVACAAQPSCAAGASTG